jgi:hypothetical protein
LGLVHGDSGGRLWGLFHGCGLSRLINDRSNYWTDNLTFLNSLFPLGALECHKKSRRNLGIDISFNLILIYFQILQKLYIKFYLLIKNYYRKLKIASDLIIAERTLLP